MSINYTYKEKYLAIVCISSTITLAAFSPYLSLALVFISLILFEVAFGRKYYIYFLPLLVLLLAYLASSRGIFETPKDDLSDYYKNFIALGDGNLFAIFEWGQGIEIGLPIVSAIISFIVPEAPPRLFLFLHLIVIFGLFFWFLHKLFLNRISSPAVFICIVCLFLGYTGIGNLLRQSYSSVFLLASLGYVGRKKVFLLIIATLFHFSAVFIYLLLAWLIRPSKKKIFVTLIATIVVYAVLWKLIRPILEEYSYLKLTAYLMGNDGLELSVLISVYKEFVLIGIMAYIYYLLGFWKSLNVAYSFILLLILVVFIELILPGISLRLNHALISFCIGPLLFYVLSVKKRISMFSVAIIIPLLFVLKAFSFINNPHDMALFDDQQLIYSNPLGYTSFLNDEIPNDKRDWKHMKYQ
ncbi:EpsG family protein [Vibrio breoganii]